DLARAAVERDLVALPERSARRRAAHREPLRLVVDDEAAAARDAALAEPARDDGGVRGHAARGREDAGRGAHAVDVLGARLASHQDDVLPLGGRAYGVVRVEDDDARRRAGARREAARERLDALRSERLGRREARLHELLERVGLE